MEPGEPGTYGEALLAPQATRDQTPDAPLENTDTSPAGNRPKASATRESELSNPHPVIEPKVLQSTAERIGLHEVHGSGSVCVSDAAAPDGTQDRSAILPTSLEHCEPDVTAGLTEPSYPGEHGVTADHASRASVEPASALLDSLTGLGEDPIPATNAATDPIAEAVTRANENVTTD